MNCGSKFPRRKNSQFAANIWHLSEALNRLYLILARHYREMKRTWKIINSHSSRERYRQARRFKIKPSLFLKEQKNYDFISAEVTPGLPRHLLKKVRKRNQCDNSWRFPKIKFDWTFFSFLQVYTWFSFNHFNV